MSQVKILRATVQNLVATATWGPGFAAEIFKNCPLSLAHLKTEADPVSNMWEGYSETMCNCPNFNYEYIKFLARIGKD
jgi:hypothetical protein